MRLETAAQYSTATQQQLLDAAELTAHPTEDAFGTNADTRHLTGSMYLAGYAVECALKSYLIRKYGTSAHGITPLPGHGEVSFDQVITVLRALPPFGTPSRSFNWRSDSHDLSRLWGVAYFPTLDPAMVANMGICGGWQVEWRYVPPFGKPRPEAEEFVQAAGELARWIAAQIP